MSKYRKDSYLSDLELFEGVRGVNKGNIHTFTVESLIIFILSKTLAALLSSSGRSHWCGKLLASRYWRASLSCDVNRLLFFLIRRRMIVNSFSTSNALYLTNIKVSIEQGWIY